MSRRGRGFTEVTVQETSSRRARILNEKDVITRTHCRHSNTHLHRRKIRSTEIASILGCGPVFGWELVWALLIGLPTEYPIHFGLGIVTAAAFGRCAMKI